MAENQSKNKRNPAEHLAPWQFKPGKSGNPLGRPKGKSMKDYARELLSRQTDEERLEYLKGLDKLDVWKMAEGNPESEVDLSGTFPATLIELLKLHGSTNQRPNPEIPGEDQK